MREPPKSLIDAIRHKMCVPFVGAGLSRAYDSANYPAWKDLLRELIHEARSCGSISSADKRDLERMLSEGRHLMVAEVLKHRLPHDAYVTILENRFSPESRRKRSTVHELLFELSPRLIITTNYDRIIEDTFAGRTGLSMTVVTHSDPGAVQRRLQESHRSERPFLFKLHGSIDDTGSMVLSEGDYRMLIHDHVGYQTVLASVFIHYTVLFLGFSLNDYELLLHLGKLRHSLKSGSSPDFALIPEGELSQLTAERFRADFGIEVIPFKKSLDNRSLVSFLRRATKLARGDKVAR